jgi:hypothetical protein
VASLGTPDVHFSGHVSNQELAAYYGVADLFLCASEHEGFCVPLIEAFHKRLPVMAYAATAVPATMDGGGLLYDTRDPRAVAAIMHDVLSSVDRQDRLLVSQDAALARLLARDFDGLVLRFVEDVLAGPKRPPVNVEPDFWRQFALAEELDAIRQRRPGAFKALPEAAGADRVADLGHRE